MSWTCDTENSFSSISQKGGNSCRGFGNKGKLRPNGLGQPGDRVSGGLGKMGLLIFRVGLDTIDS